MPRLLSLLVAILVSVLGARSAEPSSRWGKPVKGVRMALSYDVADGVLEITIENTNGTGLLLPLGQLGGQDPFVLVVTTAGSKGEAGIFVGDPGVAPGRSYPFVVPLLPGSRYVVRRPAYQYRIASANESLGKFAGRHLSLRVELVSNPDRLNINCFPSGNVWTGTLISNILPL
jgi:hypothetical protein